MELSQELVQTLAGILGSVDGIWNPMRAADWANHGSTLYAEARSDYTLNGISVRGGGSPAERKRHERLLDELEALKVTHSVYQAGRRVGVKLSDAAEWHLRAAVDLPGADTCRMAMQALAAAIDAGLCLERVEGFGLVPEMILAQCPWNWTEKHRDGIIGVNNAMLPALHRRWVYSNSCCNGRVWYALSDEGRQAMETLTGSDDLPDFDQGAFDAYEAGFARRRATIKGAKPKRSNDIGFIPLPASFWEENDALSDALEDPPRIRRRKASRPGRSGRHSKQGTRTRGEGGANL